MNRGITKENLLLILPPALTYDKSMVARASADAEALAARLAEIDRVRVISNIDGLDEAVLDILARDFKVDWYDPNYSLEEKRRTVKSSWRVHKTLGTKAAVETAIRAIYPKTDVVEWFEYEGGKPYHFRLNIDLTDTFGDETRPWRVLERVNFYKSLRSHLDQIVFTMQVKPAALHVGGSFGIAASMGVSAAGDAPAFRQTVFAGGALCSQSSIGMPEGEDSLDFQNKISVGGSLGADASIGAEAGADTPRARMPLYAGGSAAAQISLPVSEDIVQPPSTTIIRSGGVCTIISQLSKGE